MLHLLIALSLPSAQAACAVSSMSPPTDAVVTAPLTFTFLMTTDCVRSGVSVPGVAGPRNPTYVRMVAGRKLMTLTPSAADWAAWTADSRTTLPWRVTAADSLGTPTVRSAFAQLDLDADGWTRAEGDLGACDATSAQNPGVTEVCDGFDNDCNGSVDDGAGTPWYLDGDGDGYGDPTGSVDSCVQPVGRVSETGDCDDSTASVSPGAIEECNGVDDDCDGIADNAAESCLPDEPGLAAATACSTETFDGYTVGWTFTTGGSIVVTELGWYDDGEDGLNSDHAVGLFAEDGTELVSGTVSAGVGNPLTSGYRYIAIAPYTLAAGTYVVAGTSGVADPFQDFCTSVVLAAPFTWQGGRYAYSSALLYPFVPSDRAIAYFGPNFQFH